MKDIISPKKCYFCQSEGHFFCPQCYTGFPKISEICYVCKMPSDNFLIHTHCQKYFDIQSLIVLFPYRKLKRLIKDSKYYTKKDVLEDLGKHAGEALIDMLDIENSSDYIILPVPMNFWRKSKRGYNHADILAKYASQSSGIDYSTKVLKRAKNTLQQSKLNKNERLSNLNGAFQINEKYKHLIKSKKVVLIDDVASTGVTFLGVAAALDCYDVFSIDCFAIASDTQVFDENEVLG